MSPLLPHTAFIVRSVFVPAVMLKSVTPFTSTGIVWPEHYLSLLANTLSTDWSTCIWCMVEGITYTHHCWHCNRLRNKSALFSGWRLCFSCKNPTSNSCSVASQVLYFFSVLLLVQPPGVGWIPCVWCSHTCCSAARSRGPNLLWHEKKLAGTVHY